MKRTLPSFNTTLEQGILKNGVKVFHFKRPGMPIHIQAVLFAGSRFDLIPGTAHFVEHMLVSGSEKFPTKHSLAHHIESVGGERNAYTSVDIQAIVVTIPEKSDIAVGIDILDAAFHPLFDKTTIEKERGAILAEYKGKRSNPLQWASNASRALLLQETGAGHSSLGNEETIASITEKDLRDFYTKNIHADNLTVISSGDIEIEELIQALENGFHPLHGEKNLSQPFLAISKKTVSVISYPNAKQLEVRCGFRTNPESFKEKCALDLLGFMLGGSPTSFMANDLRYKHGIIYSYGTSTYHSPDWSYLELKFATSEKDIDLALTTLWERLETIQNSLGSDDVESAKVKFTKRMNIRLQTSEAWVNRHLMECFFDDPQSIHTAEDLKKETLSLSTEDIRKVAQKYFKKDLLLLAICGGDGSLEKRMLEWKAQ